MIHISPSKFLFASKTRSTITSPHTSAAMAFPVSDFTMELERHVPWWQQIAKLRNTPSWNQGCARPNPIQFSNIQALGARWRSPAEPSGTRHLAQINEDRLQADHHLDARRILGPPPVVPKRTAGQDRLLFWSREHPLASTRPCRRGLGGYGQRTTHTLPTLNVAGRGLRHTLPSWWRILVGPRSSTPSPPLITTIRHQRRRSVPLPRLGISALDIALGFSCRRCDRLPQHLWHQGPPPPWPTPVATMMG
jgi:hypothetical protein